MSLELKKQTDWYEIGDLQSIKHDATDVENLVAAPSVSKMILGHLFARIALVFGFEYLHYYREVPLEINTPIQTLGEFFGVMEELVRSEETEKEDFMTALPKSKVRVIVGMKGGGNPVLLAVAHATNDKVAMPADMLESFLSVRFMEVTKGLGMSFALHDTLSGLKDVIYRQDERLARLVAKADVSDEARDWMKSLDKENVK